MPPSFVAPDRLPFRPMRRTSPLLTASLLPLLAGSAMAGGGRGGPPPTSGGGMSDSVRRVERQTGGQVLSAEPVQGAQGDLYRVKVLDDRGRVRVFMDDPRARDDNRDPPGRTGREGDSAAPPRGNGRPPRGDGPGWR